MLCTHTSNTAVRLQRPCSGTLRLPAAYQPRLRCPASRTVCKAAVGDDSAPGSENSTAVELAEEGPSTDVAVIWGRLVKVGNRHIRRRSMCNCILHDSSRWVSNALSACHLQLTMPYWQDTETNNGARMKLAGVVALTLGTTGVRCMHHIEGCATTCSAHTAVRDAMCCCHLTNPVVDAWCAVSCLTSWGGTSSQRCLIKTWTSSRRC